MEELNENVDLEKSDTNNAENNSAIQNNETEPNKNNADSKTPTTIKERLFKLCKRTDVLVQFGLLTALWIVVSVALGVWQNSASINVSKNLMLIMFVVSLIILVMVATLFVISLVLVISGKMNKKSK